MINLSDCYDITKRGTIVVGIARSGTHHLSSLVSDELRRNNVEHTLRGELPLVDYFNSTDDQWQIFSKSDSDILKTLALNENSYTVCSVVFLNLFQVLLRNTFKDFSVIYLTRKNIWAHFVSYAIFNQVSNRGFVISADSIKDISVPFFVPMKEVTIWAASRYKVVPDLFQNEKIVYYEDIQHLPSSWPRSSHIDKHPSEIFTNYKEIDALFQKVVSIHGW